MTDTPLTTGRIAEIVGGTCQGDPAVPIDSIGSLDSAGPGQVTFATDKRRAAKLAGSAATAAIVPDSLDLSDLSMPLIRVDDVQRAVACLLSCLAPPEDLPPVGRSDSAVIDPGAELAEDVRVGPGVVIGSQSRIAAGCALAANVVIGPDVEIGRDCVIQEGVVIRRGSRIGSRVRIGPNSVIGRDGFGYYFADGQHNKIKHIGNVVIADDVEIGACVCVDRAKFGSTLIGAGTKIDNLVQIAHNVQIGRGCILVSQSGMAGSSRLGQYVILGGHVAISDNITLGNGVTCGGYTAVTHDVPDGQTLFGIPAIGHREKFRQISLTAKLPEIVKRLAKLEGKLKALEQTPADREPKRQRD